MRTLLHYYYDYAYPLYSIRLTQSDMHVGYSSSILSFFLLTALHYRDRNVSGKRPHIASRPAISKEKRNRKKKAGAAS